MVVGTISMGEQAVESFHSADVVTAPNLDRNKDCDRSLDFNVIDSCENLFTSCLMIVTMK